MNRYILLKTDKNELYLFYYSEGSIYFKQLAKNQNISPIKIISDVSDIFSVWYENSFIYLLASTDSNAVLCRYNGKWNSKKLNFSIPNECTKLFFTTAENSISFIYSVKENHNNEYLYMRYMLDDRWEQPIKISEILSFGNSPFLIGMNNNNIKIYYRLSDKTIKFFSMSVKDCKLTESISFLATNMPCIDLSVLTENNSSHLLYLAKSSFSSQLIYKGCINDCFGKARILWEGQNGRGCSISKEKGAMYAIVHTNSSSYKIPIESISKPQLVKQSYDLRKAEYLNFFDDFSPNRIEFNLSDFSFPFMNDDFVPYIQAQKPVSTANQSNSHDYLLQLEETNNRVSELSRLLAERNEEIALLSSKWKARYNAVEKENIILKNRLKAMSIPESSDKSDIIFIQSREL